MTNIGFLKIEEMTTIQVKTLLYLILVRAGGEVTFSADEPESMPRNAEVKKIISPDGSRVTFRVSVRGSVA